MLSNATAEASCISTSGTALVIGQYTSSLYLQNDIAFFKGDTYATLTSDDGKVQLFMTPFDKGSGEQILEPLKQFGFQLQQIPRGNG